MKTIEEILNGVLQERGYIVLGGARPLISGDVVQGADGIAHGQFETLKHPLVVLRETDEADWEVQQQLLGNKHFANWSHYYRVTAE